VRVCVLGGTGNISTAIVDLLVERGDDVTIFNRGQRAVTVPAGVTVWHGDRQQRVDFEARIRSGQFDAVIDMIAFTAEDSASVVRALAGSATHLVHCSTVCALGVDYDNVPTPPDEPARPTTAYGQGKWEAEQLLNAVFGRGELPVTILRPSHTYGQTRILRQLGFDVCYVDRLRQGKPIVVSTDAEERRWQSTDRRDVASGFVGALGRDACFGRTYHLVTDEVMSWADHHRVTAAALGFPEPHLVPLPIDRILAAAEGTPRLDVFRTITAYDGWYDNTSAKRDIPEFAPRIPYREGVVGNVEWAERHGLIASADSDSWEDGLLTREMVHEQ
jgi:nucleoside-diphosphate-sugar epimerase